MIRHKKLAIFLSLGVAALCAAWFSSEWAYGPDRGGPVTAVAEGDQLVISPESLLPLLSGASGTETGILADGVVTKSEYGAAVEVTLACLTQRGFRIVHYQDTKAGVFFNFTRLSSAADGPQTNAWGLIEFGATGGNGSSVEENSRLVQECKRNSALVERLWAEHLGPRVATGRAEQMEALAHCLRTAGVAVQTISTERELRRAAFPIDPAIGVGKPSDEYMACENQLAVAK